MTLKHRGSNQLEFLNALNQYSLEVIMVYTLGSVVNNVQSEFPVVRLSTPVEHLDSLVRTHARLMKDRRCGSFLWSLLPTHFTPVYRSNYSKLTSSLAQRGCRKVKIGSVPGHGDMLDWIKGCFVDSII
ncbi:hypothetical protein E3N88_29575 [Mikania micrantha]|uniref:Uncharacterized protein n=1 Tax=Mikania micrantha TaxID=192012 RepID=A0A5N6MJY2_9ASTR|nr:hypothetical protein E3N88_29575 [Mikania micrantha]